VDVGALLRQARERVGFSQRELAARVGTGQSAISMYESGAHSPTVRTLDRLLAACGFQARVVLEPLGADLDAQVASLVAGAPELDVDQLVSLARTLDDDPAALRMGFAPWKPTGAATWAFDGATALRVQGLAVPETDLAVVVVLDEGTRQWLWRLGAKGTGRVVAPHWLYEETELVAEVLASPVVSMLGFVRIRLCEVLPPVLRVVVGPEGETVPVVSVDEVEHAHPEYAEVLAAWRSRRTVGL
jgi:transcriptional regulator with XRE-family HTH domain